MTREQSAQQLHQNQIKMSSLGRQYMATTSLFEEACFNEDGVSAASHREKLHALVDLILDTASGSMALSRQLIGVRR